MQLDLARVQTGGHEAAGTVAAPFCSSIQSLHLELGSVWRLPPRSSRCAVSAFSSRALGQASLPWVPSTCWQRGEILNSFCFPGRQRGKGPFGPTVTLCL